MREKFIALDYLRGVAALFVIILHARWTGSFQELNFIQNAYLFVDLFFILSGFVMYHTYKSRLDSVKVFLPFIIARIARLYPLHLLVLLTFLIFELLKWYLQAFHSMSSDSVAFEGRNSFSNFIEHIFLVQAIGIHPESSWNGPSWSISTEFWTYILFAIAMINIKSINHFFVLLISILFYFITYEIEGTLNYEGVFRCIAGFSLGVYCYSIRGCITSRYLNLSLCILSTTISCILLSIKPVASIYDFLVPPTFFMLILTFSGVKRKGNETVIDKALNFLGALSYTMYMIHAAMIFVLSNILSRVFNYTSNGFRVLIPSFNDSFLITLIYIVSVILISFFINVFFELPLQKMINNLFKKRKRI